MLRLVEGQQDFYARHLVRTEKSPTREDIAVCDISRYPFGDNDEEALTRAVLTHRRCSRTVEPGSWATCDQFG